MKITTINVPKTYLPQMDVIVKENQIYPSRSELIRSSTRDLLLKELSFLKTKTKKELSEHEKKIIAGKIVDIDDKTYKITKQKEKSSIIPIVQPKRKWQKPKNLIILSKHNLYFNNIVSFLYERGDLNAYKLSKLIGVAQGYASGLVNKIILEYPGLIQKKVGTTRGYGRTYTLNKNLLKEYIKGEK